MGMLDFLQENWRDIYRPFQRYPEIYGEHAKQGMGMLREDAPGAWDIATKPLGALMMSGIPSLYEAFRDEPIRNTLIDDLGIDPKKADYATQAIGLGMDVGVPYAVIRKGLTPWISEQVAKQANPTGFSPSRRRFLKGTTAAAAGTATGIPVWKQVAKTVPDAFGGLIAKMSSTVGSIGAKGTVAAGINRFGREFGDLSDHLVGMRRHREDMIDVSAAHDSKAHTIRQYRKAHPVKETGKAGDYYAGANKELTTIKNSIRDQVNREQKEFVDRPNLPGYPKETLYSPNFGPMNTSFGHVERAKTHYEADPKGFILALENKIKVLKEGTRHHTAKLRSGELGPYEAKQLGWYAEDNASLTARLEDFLKELKAQQNARHEGKRGLEVGQTGKVFKTRQEAIQQGIAIRMNKKRKT